MMALDELLELTKVIITHPEEMPQFYGNPSNGFTKTPKKCQPNVAQEEKSRDHQSQCDSSSGDHE